MSKKHTDIPATSFSPEQLTEAEWKRYNRHIILAEIGLEGQEKIKNAKVLVVGAGGLGCPVLQYLTAAGVGTIGVIDPDKVDETNLQRQVLYAINDIGTNKAETAVAKLSGQNPYVHFDTFTYSLTKENVLQIFPIYDIIIDGTDNFATRYLVNDACVILDKPFVSGSIYKFEGQVSVFNYHNGPTYRCLYPEPGDTPSCSEVGVLGTLPGFTGCIMANEVLKMITGTGDVLSGKLLVMDLLAMNFNTFGFSLVPGNKVITTLGDYDFFCENPNREITADELKKKIASGEPFQLIDVREPYEYEQHNIGGILIPLAELENHITEIATDRTVIIHCRSGSRSRKAIELLRQKGNFDNVYNLKNGLLDF
jgi:adenylyltransferase/sulfurtransferase